MKTEHKIKAFLQWLVFDFAVPVFTVLFLLLMISGLYTLASSLD